MRSVVLGIILGVMRRASLNQPLNLCHLQGVGQMLYVYYKS